MANSTTVFVSGKVYWAKILGDPRPNYEGTAREWTYEFEPDNIDFLKQHKLLDRLKNKNATGGRGDYLNLKKPEFDKDGNPNKHIRVYDADNTDWGTDRLLGNGTAVDAKLRIVDWGPGKKKSIYTIALRVTDLVPYISNEFGGMDKDSSAPAKKTTKVSQELDDLDDDLPFE